MQTALVVVIAALVTLCVLLALAVRRGYFEVPGLYYRASVMSRAAAMPSVREAMPLINQELGRARRYERVLSVAVIEIRHDELLRQIRTLISADRSIISLSERRQTARVVRVVFALIGCVLRDALRDTDVVAYDPASDRYLIVMPESNKLEAQQVVHRAREMLLKRTAAEAKASIAEFPRDGLNFEDLVSTLELASPPPRAGTVPDETAA